MSLLRTDCWMSDWLPYVIGYGFATIVGHYPIKWLVDRLWLSNGENKTTCGKHRPGWWLPKIVGWVERTLYVASINAGFPQFIGVWLAMKVAGEWYAWKDGIKEVGSDVSGGSIYDIFIIGNGVSLAYALVGYYLISECRKSVTNSILVPLAVLAATACLWCKAKSYEKKKQ